MEKRFLRSYMDLLVQTCHRRGALATGGMAALLLPQDAHSDSYRSVLATVTRLALSPNSKTLLLCWGFIVLFCLFFIVNILNDLTNTSAF